MGDFSYLYDDLAQVTGDKSYLKKKPPVSVSPDEDLAVRTVIGEAKHEGDRGWKAVAGVIRNRANRANQTFKDVVLAPHQFEPWSSRKKELESYDPNSSTYQQVAQSILPVLRGEAPDPTGGATHFYSPKGQAALGRSAPSWENGKGIDIGNHRFFKLGYGGKASKPTEPDYSFVHHDLKDILGDYSFAQKDIADTLGDTPMAQMPTEKPLLRPEDVQPVEAQPAQTSVPTAQPNLPLTSPDESQAATPGLLAALSPQALHQAIVPSGGAVQKRRPLVKAVGQPSALDTHVDTGRVLPGTDYNEYDDNGNIIKPSTSPNKLEFDTTFADKGEDVHGKLVSTIQQKMADLGYTEVAPSDIEQVLADKGLVHLGTNQKVGEYDLPRNQQVHFELRPDFVNAVNDLKTRREQNTQKTEQTYGKKLAEYQKTEDADTAQILAQRDAGMMSNEQADKALKEVPAEKAAAEEWTQASGYADPAYRAAHSKEYERDVQGILDQYGSFLNLKKENDRVKDYYKDKPYSQIAAMAPTLFGNETMNKDTAVRNLYNPRTRLSDDEIQRAEDFGKGLKSYVPNEPYAQFHTGAALGFGSDLADIGAGVLRYGSPILNWATGGKASDWLDRAAEQTRIAGQAAKPEGAMGPVYEGGQSTGGLPGIMGATVLAGGNPVLGFAIHSALTKSGKPIEEQTTGVISNAVLGGVFEGAPIVEGIGGEVLDSLLKKIGLASDSTSSKIIQTLFEKGKRIGAVGSIGAGQTATAGGSKEEIAKSGVQMGLMEFGFSAFGHEPTKAEWQKLDKKIVTLPDENGKPVDVLLTKTNSGVEATDVSGLVPNGMQQAVVAPKDIVPKPGKQVIEPSKKPESPERRRQTPEEAYQGNERRNAELTEKERLLENSTPTTVHNLASDKGLDVDSSEFKDKSKELTGKSDLDAMEPKELLQVGKAIEQGEFGKSSASTATVPRAVEGAKEPSIVPASKEPWQMRSKDLPLDTEREKLPGTDTVITTDPFGNSIMELRKGGFEVLRAGATHSTVEGRMGKNNLADAQSRLRQLTESSHQQAVERAFSQDKPVPPEVLADYPDLQAKPEQPTELKPPTSRDVEAKGKTAESRAASIDSGETRIAPSDIIKTAEELVDQHNEERAKEFHTWFEGSKVVDKNAKPLRVYHFTSAKRGEITTFKPLTPNDPIWFTDDPSYPDKAMIGNKDESQGISAYLNLKNPLDMRGLGEFASGAQKDAFYKRRGIDLKAPVRERDVAFIEPRNPEFKQALEKAGYDGAILTETDGTTSYLAFKPEQIKNAIGYRDVANLEVKPNEKSSPPSPDTISRQTAESKSEPRRASNKADEQLSRQVPEAGGDKAASGREAGKSQQLPSQQASEPSAGGEDTQKQPAVEFGKYTRESKDAAVARLRAKLGGDTTSFSSGLNLDEETANLIKEIAGYHIKQGVKHLSDLADKVAKEIGIAVDKIRPHLEKLYPAMGEPPKGIHINLKEPEGKPSKIGQDIKNKAVEEGLAEDWGETATYSPKTMAEQAEMANTLISQDPQQAIRIIEHQEEPPEGLHPESVYTALRKQAEDTNDVELLKTLSRAKVASESSIYGQKIKMLDMQRQQSTVAIMRSLEKGDMTPEQDRRFQRLQKTYDEKLEALHQRILGLEEQQPSPHVLSVAQRMVKNLNERADMARERLKKRGVVLSAGLDPLALKDYAEIGASHIAQAGLDFAKWSERMIGEFGDSIKPHLDKIWAKSQSIFDRGGNSSVSNTLKSYETRLTNQIADMENQIRIGERRAAKTRTTPEYDENIQKLRERRDNLKKQLDDIFGKPELTDAQRLSRWMKGAETRKAELEKKLKAGDFSVAERRAVPLDAQGRALQAQIKNLNDQMQKMRNITGELSDEEISKLNELVHKVNNSEGLEHGYAANDLDAYVSSIKAQQLSDRAWWRRVASGAYRVPMTVLTFGHGGVIPFTHARNSLFLASEMGPFFRAVGRAYAYKPKEGGLLTKAGVPSGDARWKLDMAKLRSDPLYEFAAKNGLAIKPSEKPVGLGMARWTNHSFDALKTMRLELFKKAWNKFDKDAQTPELAQRLSKDINHNTGDINSPPVVSKIAGTGMFAPKLRLAKYANALVDPFTSARAAKRAATLISVNLGLLAVNDLMNRYLFGVTDKDKLVNWTDPHKADWLRGKVAGMAIPLAPAFEVTKLPFKIGADIVSPSFVSGVPDRSKTIRNEAFGALHPTLHAAYELGTGEQSFYPYKELPFPGAAQLVGKATHNKNGKETYPEYAAGFAPIPTQPILKNLAQQGVHLNPKLAPAIIEAFLSGAMGEHVYEADKKSSQVGPQPGQPPQ